jgi:aryl-alcohol dehydrogenase-like predicted oxidoreductase
MRPRRPALHAETKSLHFLTFLLVDCHNLHTFNDARAGGLRKMAISRRDFTKAGLGAGALLTLGGALRAEHHEMLKKAIPSSGELIPAIGVGTNRYGVGGDRKARRPLKAALARFHKLGGTVIDTAPGYRSSEAVLGELIAELGIADDLFMATKVDERGNDEQNERMSRSLRLLKYQTVDLMQCHNLVGWESAIPLMREWQEEGRIRYVGITSSREHQYELMEKIMKTHDLDFIQINYSLADQRLSEQRLLPLAADRGMAVLVNRPFGGGGVFGKLGNTAFPEWAHEFGATTWGQFLLKYVLSHPAVTGAIPGMTKVDHVVDNMGAGLGRLPTTAERKQQEEFFDAL